MTPTNSTNTTDTFDDVDTDAASGCSILMVRHGQSEWNATGRWQGQADPPLTDLGRRQAVEAAAALNAFDVVWSSDLQRARDTARLIADELAIDDVRIDPRLRERDAGAWSGLTRVEIHEQYPGFLDDGRRPDGWEHDDELRERVLEALVHISSVVGAGGRALAVTHGGCIYCMEATIDVEGGRIPNLGAREIRLSPAAITLGERVALLDESIETTPKQI